MGNILQLCVPLANSDSQETSPKKNNPECAISMSRFTTEELRKAQLQEALKEIRKWEMNSRGKGKRGSDDKNYLNRGFLSQEALTARARERKIPHFPYTNDLVAVAAV